MAAIHNFRAGYMGQFLGAENKILLSMVFHEVTLRELVIADDFRVLVDIASWVNRCCRSLLVDYVGDMGNAWIFCTFKEQSSSIL